MKVILCVAFIIFFSLRPVRSYAQVPLPLAEIIKAGIVKVIKAVDLKLQRLQNETIWLQNAQKVIENTLSELKLREIAEWSEKQRVLYADYFDELYRVKDIIAYYQRIRRVTEIQLAMVKVYQSSFALFRNDKHFTIEEVAFMEREYSAIISESLKNVEQIRLVLQSFSLQMSDAKRLEIIDAAADRIDRNYERLLEFNDSNRRVSFERAKNLNEIDMLKTYYGIQ